MRSLTLLILALALSACLPYAPRPSEEGHWTYIGNDPDGTQNIFMRVQSTDKKLRTVTSWFRFEFINPRQLHTGPALTAVTYFERRDLAVIDCASQTLKLVDETFHDVDGKQVFKVVPNPDGSTAAQVFAGGVSDVLYAGACGNSLDWTALGEDPQKTQDVYALVEHAVKPGDTVRARFRFVYHTPRTLVAAPKLETVKYVTRQASVLMNCLNRSFTLIGETYYDSYDIGVFGVKPPADTAPTPVVNATLTDMMYKAACNIPLDWTYLGTDPKNTQKIYLVDAPSEKSKGTFEAHFHFEYMAPAKLVTGADLHQVQYSSRNADMLLQCPDRTLTLQHESYLDSDGKEVFSVAPAPAAQKPVAVAPQGVTGMLYSAACHSSPAADTP